MERANKPNYRNLYLTTFIVDLPFISVGHVAGWSSPSIPIITSADFFLEISADQASLATSMMPLGGMVGPFISGALLDVVGRKNLISINNALTLLGWIIQAFAWSVEMIYIGRFILGCTSAVTFTSVPIYISEISEPSMRGLINNIALISRCLTILFQFAVGPYVSYFTLNALSGIASVLYFVLVYWMPESPYFLIAKGKTEEAVKCLTSLRGEMSPSMLNKEISNIQAYLEKSSQKASYKDLFNKKYRKPVLLTIVVLGFSQLVGAGIVILYLESIFQASGSSLSSSASAILVGIAMTLAGLAVPLVVKLYGYKKPMVASSVGIGVCLAILGGYFFLKDLGINYEVLNYVPIISVVAYMVILSLGMLNLPWALAGELLPSNIKAQASAIATSFGFVVGFLTSITFPSMRAIMGNDLSFWIYACFCFMSAYFVYYYIPETKGLTLSEIQDFIKLPPKINSNIETMEQCTVSYLKTHYEINTSPAGRYNHRYSVT